MARYMEVSSTLSASSAVCAIASAAVVRRRCHFVILRSGRGPCRLKLQFLGGCTQQHPTCNASLWLRIEDLLGRQLMSGDSNWINAHMWTSGKGLKPVSLAEALHSMLRL